MLLLDGDHLSIRLSLWIHPRLAYPLQRYVLNRGVITCGVDLPVGTVVGVSPHMVHRHRDINGKDPVLCVYSEEPVPGLTAWASPPRS